MKQMGSNCWVIEWQFGVTALSSQSGSCSINNGAHPHVGHLAEVISCKNKEKKQQIGCCWRSMAVFWHSSCVPQGLIDYSIAAVRLSCRASYSAWSMHQKYNLQVPNDLAKWASNVKLAQPWNPSEGSPLRRTTTANQSLYQDLFRWPHGGWVVGAPPSCLELAWFALGFFPQFPKHACFGRRMGVSVCELWWTSQGVRYKDNGWMDLLKNITGIKANPSHL